MYIVFCVYYSVYNVYHISCISYNVYNIVESTQYNCIVYTVTVLNALPIAHHISAKDRNHRVFESFSSLNFIVFIKFFLICNINSNLVESIIFDYKINIIASTVLKRL